MELVKTGSGDYVCRPKETASEKELRVLMSKSKERESDPVKPVDPNDAPAMGSPPRPSPKKAQSQQREGSKPRIVDKDEDDEELEGSQDEVEDRGESPEIDPKGDRRIHSNGKPITSTKRSNDDRAVKIKEQHSTKITLVKLFLPTAADILHKELLRAVDQKVVSAKGPPWDKLVHLCGKCHSGSRCVYYLSPERICRHYAKNGWCKFAFQFAHKTFAGAKPCDFDHYITDGRTWFMVLHPEVPMPSTKLTTRDIKDHLRALHQEKRDKEEQAKETRTLQHVRSSYGDAIVTIGQEGRREKTLAQKTGTSFDPVANAEGMQKMVDTYLQVRQALAPPKAAEKPTKSYRMTFPHQKK